MYFENSYFKLLSNEIVIKILHYVDIFDLLQFSEAYNIDDFLQVHKLIKHFNLSREYRLEDLKLIWKRGDLSFITTLNINGLYWINGNDLRRLLRKFTNLKDLLAIDTALDLNEDDFIVYSELKLNKLAINLRVTKITTTITLPTIETLLLIRYSSVVIPWERFPALKSLWSEDTEHNTNCQANTSVEKLLLKSQRLRTIRVRPCQYLAYRLHRLTILFYDDVQIPKIVENNWPEEWRRLRSARANYPFPYRTFYVLKEKNIDEIMFDELNFQHEARLCVFDRTIYKGILLSSSVKKLKKLSINLCLLQCDHFEKQTDENVLKKRRFVAADEPCQLFEKHFLYNCKSLQVLELHLCAGIFGMPIHKLHDALSLLCHLKQLKHFSIELSPFLNAKFLINLLKECRQLEVLKVSSLFTNDGLCLHLCNALPNAHNLKHFILKTLSIPILQFLTLLCDLKRPKLKRISLICDNLNETETNYDGILERFLECNPQLIFVYFRFRHCPPDIYESFNSILTKFTRQHPTRFYVITRLPIVDEVNLNIPHMHYEEMVLCRTVVSCPNPYEDFIDF